MLHDLRIIFAGSGEFGVPTLRHLLDLGLHIEVIISQPDRPGGRGRKFMPTPISQLALTRSIPLARTDDINRVHLPDADLLIVIAFGQKLKPRIINHARWGAINLHASILPRWRGAAPINWAMMAGDTHTGNSVIRLADKMDAGAIIAQSSLEIGEIETAGELHDRLAQDGKHLVEQAIEEIVGGTARPIEQDPALATRAPKLTRQHTELDFSQPAEHIARRIRAMHPWPGCHVRLVDLAGTEVDRMTLVRARAVPFYYARAAMERCGLPLVRVPAGVLGNPYNFPPGSAPRIGTGDDFGVEVLELQPEGKRVMPLSAYCNGHRWESGMRIQSII
jgi:methionyl-tRNA formyltransferase